MNWPVLKAKKLAAGLLFFLLAVILVLLSLVSLVLTTQGGSRWVLSRVADQLNNLPGQQLALGEATGTLAGGLQLREVSYGSDTIQVSVAQIDIDWNPLALLSRRVSVSTLRLTDSLIEFTPAESSAPSTRQPGDPLLSFAPLPVTLEFDQVTLDGLQYRQPGQELQLESVNFSIGLAEQEVSVSDLDLISELADITGDLSLSLREHLPLEVELNWRYHPHIFPDSGPTAGSLTLGGDLSELQVTHLLTEPFLLSSQGLVDVGVTGNALTLNLTHDSSALVLPTALTGTPLALNELSLLSRGNLDRLQISLAMEVESDLAPPASIAVEAILRNSELVVEPFTLTTSTGRLDGSASINLGSTITGALQYQFSEAAPLGYLTSFREDGADELPFEILNLFSRGAASFTAADGSVQAALQIAELAGEFGDYPFQGSGQLEYLDGSLQFDAVNLSTADNQLTVAGSLADELDFGWEINAPRLDQFMAGLTGRLNARGEVGGTLDDLSLSSTIDLASARFDAYGIDNLELELALLEGNLQGLLSVTGASLQAGDRVDSIDSLTLQVSGSEARHTLSLSALSNYGKADLAATGGFTDLAALAWEGSLDRGTLETPVGEWSTASASAISVTSDVIRISDNCWTQNAASVCLDFSMLDRTTNPVTQLRGNINNYSLQIFNHPDSLPEELAFQLQAIPQLPETVSLSGFVDAELALTLEPESNPAINVQVLPRAVSVDLRSADTEESIETEPSEPISQTWLLVDPNLTARLQDNRWEFAAISGIGRLDASDSAVTTPGSLSARGSLAEDGNLAATVNASLDDLAWLGAFVPTVTNIGGSLAAGIDLSGTLSEPQLALDIQLNEGQFELAALGVAFTDITTRLSSDSNDLIELSASAVSGTGDLAFSGRLTDPLSTTRRLEASLSGQQFTLANLPDLRLAISPELEATANSERIDVSGNLTIPVLNLILRELPEQAVDVSRDVVVVAYPSEQPDLAVTIAAEQSSVFNIPVIADVNILLGDNVSLEAFGFTSTLAGNLNVRQRENGTNLTYGELEIVQGDYRMYGQSLQIRGGKLLFFGAIDNPALDMRATRTVGDTTVGVLMNGTLKNIRSQLFSTPALPDSDIIAILATGKPFSEIGQGEQDRDAMLGSIARLGLSRSQGLTNQVREQLGLDALAITNTGSINNTTLTVGKYLTPDIFIRYGFGIFDHQSKLALDYFLTERFTLQAETGEYQSVDVIYRVER